MSSPYEWKRATASIIQQCQLCQVDTNRLTCFKKAEEKGYQSIFICQDCHDGMKTITEAKPGDG